MKINCRTKGFSLNVPIGNKNVSLFRGYCQLANNGQHVVSTSYFIKDKVKDGNKIVEQFNREIIKIEGFNETGDGFMFMIEENLDDDNWNLFENTISKITSQIKENGMK